MTINNSKGQTFDKNLLIPSRNLYLVTGSYMLLSLISIIGLSGCCIGVEQDC
jgi:hypothetical protein